MGRRNINTVRVSISATSLLISGLFMASQVRAGYDEDVAPIMKSKCISCHATQAPKLNTYAEVKAAVVGIVSTISVEESGPEKGTLMPKDGPKLDQTSIDKIKSWQSAGTPEKAGAAGDTAADRKPETPPAADDTPVTPGADTADTTTPDPGTSPGTDVNGPGTENGKPTPIILDLEGKGNFSFAKKTVDFDILGNGLEQKISWPSATSAFLALDLNGNKIIDSGAELFGDSTVLLQVQSKKASNGFEALAQYDSNHDGFIDRSDPIFSRLLIWHDKNENGRTDHQELSALNAHAVTSLSLAFVGHVQTMSGGVEIPLLVSYYLTTDSKGVSTNKVLADIFLTYQAK